MLLAAFAAACADHPVSPVARSAPADAAASNASSGTPPVSLSVTVSDADVAGAQYRIRSDGQGAYVDGSQNVQALLDQTGTFAFNTRATTKPAVRSVTYDLSAPLDPNYQYRPTPSSMENYHFSTSPSAFNPFIPLPTLGVNGNPSTECIYMANSLANASTGWRVSSHKGHEDVSGSPTAFAVVTRTSVSPAAWTVTPVGACSPNSNVASLRSGDGTVLYGYYMLPFYFTLRAR